MDLKITVFCEIEGAERTYELKFTQDEVSIGRDAENLVPIPGPEVSDRHARIQVCGDGWCLVDLGSVTGTTVDGSTASPHQEVALEIGSEIRIASYRLVLEKPAESLDETTSEHTAMVAMDMVREVLGSLSSIDDDPPHAVVQNDAEEGTKLTLSEEREYKIGREKTCDLILKHWSISRKHALLRRSGSEVTIMDLGSKNGVMVNADRLEGSMRLKSGDVISVGHTEVKFTVPGAEESGGILSSLGEEEKPLTDLGDLGGGGASASSTSAASTPSEPARPPERKLQKESSFADYLPIILGVIVVLAVAAVAVYMFVIKK